MKLHPTRVAVLRELAAEPASPVILAEQLGEPLGTVAYHVRVLLAAGLIQPDRERRVRGAVEHVYRLDATGRRVVRPFLERQLRESQAALAALRQADEAERHGARLTEALA